MSKRRSKAEQIADLEAAHQRDLLHTGARATNAEIKTLLHKRKYGDALAAIDALRLDVATLAQADAFETTDQADAPEPAEQLPVPFGGASAAS